MIDTITRVETPEGVRLSFRTAGVPARAIAAAVDVAIRVSVVMTISSFLQLFSVAGGAGIAGFGTGVTLLLYFAAEWVYCTLFEWLWGTTPGKRWLDLRVVRLDGGPIRFSDAAIRNLLRAADALPTVTIVPFYAVGLVSCLVTARQQRIGDLVAGTIVVHERSSRLGRRVTLPARVTPFAWGEVHAQRPPGPRALLLIDRLLRRSRTLPMARAQEVAAILAEPLAKRLSYEAPVTDPMLFVQRVFASYAVDEPRGPSATAAASSASPLTTDPRVPASAENSSSAGSTTPPLEDR